MDPLAGLLSSLQGMEAGSLAAIQLLLRPSVVMDLEGPAFEVVLRLLAQGPSKVEARLQLLRMLSAFGPYAAANRLRPLGGISTSGRRVRQFRKRRWPLLRWHVPILSLEELATLYHFPDHPLARQVGVAMDESPYLRLGEAPPEGGLVQRRWQIPRAADTGAAGASGSPARHTLVLAATGGGKSTLLANLALELARKGDGFTLLDPHGELVRTLVESLPEGRLGDVALLRFADPDYPVGLNVLRSDGGESFLVAEELVEVLRRVYAQAYWGPLLETVLRHAALAVAEAGGNPGRDGEAPGRRHFSRGAPGAGAQRRDGALLGSFGQLGAGSQERRAASTATRLQRFLASPLMRNIVGQAHSRFDPDLAMDRGQVVLVDLSGIGISNAKLLGSMLTALYYQAALAREAIPPEQRRRHLLIMDECSWFISPTVAEMADQVRKYGLGLCLAAQRLSEIKPDEVRDAIFANFANLICFALGEQGEATYVARHLNTPGLGAEEIRRLPPFQAYAQVLLKGRRSPAFTLDGLGPPPPAPDGEGRWGRLLPTAEPAMPGPARRWSGSWRTWRGGGRKGGAIPRCASWMGKPWPCPSMLPTPRDRAIILAVYTHGRLSREQVRRLFFRKRPAASEVSPRLASVQAVGARLKRLAEAGYLSRVARPVLTGSGQYLYALGALGSRLLAAEYKITANSPSRRSLAGAFLALNHTSVASNGWRPALGALRTLLPARGTSNGGPSDYQTRRVAAQRPRRVATPVVASSREPVGHLDRTSSGRAANWA